MRLDHRPLPPNNSLDDKQSTTCHIYLFNCLRRRYLCELATRETYKEQLAVNIIEIILWALYYGHTLSTFDHFRSRDCLMHRLREIAKIVCALDYNSSVTPLQQFTAYNRMKQLPSPFLFHVAKGSRIVADSWMSIRLIITCIPQTDPANSDLFLVVTASV